MSCFSSGGYSSDLNAPIDLPTSARGIRHLFHVLRNASTNPVTRAILLSASQSSQTVTTETADAAQNPAAAGPLPLGESASTASTSLENKSVSPTFSNFYQNRDAELCYCACIIIQSLVRQINARVKAEHERQRRRSSVGNDGNREAMKETKEQFKLYEFEAQPPTAPAASNITPSTVLSSAVISVGNYMRHRLEWREKKITQLREIFFHSPTASSVFGGSPVSSVDAILSSGVNTSSYYHRFSYTCAFHMPNYDYTYLIETNMAMAGGSALAVEPSHINVMAASSAAMLTNSTMRAVTSNNNSIHSSTCNVVVSMIPAGGANNNDSFFYNSQDSFAQSTPSSPPEEKATTTTTGSRNGGAPEILIPIPPPPSVVQYLQEKNEEKGEKKSVDFRKNRFTSSSSSVPQGRKSEDEDDDDEEMHKKQLQLFQVEIDFLFYNEGIYRYHLWKEMDTSLRTIADFRWDAEERRQIQHQEGVHRYWLIQEETQNFKSLKFLRDDQRREYDRRMERFDLLQRELTERDVLFQEFLMDRRDFELLEADSILKMMQIQSRENKEKGKSEKRRKRKLEEEEEQEKQKQATVGSNNEEIISEKAEEKKREEKSEEKAKQSKTTTIHDDEKNTSPSPSASKNKNKSDDEKSSSPLKYHSPVSKAHREEQAQHIREINKQKKENAEGKSLLNFVILSEREQRDAIEQSWFYIFNDALNVIRKELTSFYRSFHQLYAAERLEYSQRRLIVDEYFTMLIDACFTLEVLHRREFSHYSFPKYMKQLTVEERTEWLSTRKREQDRFKKEELDEIERDEYLRQHLHEWSTNRLQQKLILSHEESAVRFEEIIKVEQDEFRILQSQWDLENTNIYFPIQFRYEAEWKKKLTTMVWTEEPYEQVYLAEIKHRDSVERDQEEVFAMVRKTEATCYQTMRKKIMVNQDVARELEHMEFGDH